MDSITDRVMQEARRMDSITDRAMQEASRITSIMVIRDSSRAVLHRGKRDLILIKSKNQWFKIRIL